MATTLYLVSAETPQGEGYWKVGITAKTDPLKRDPKRYREVFRAVRLEDREAVFVENKLRDAFKAVGTFIGWEAISGFASLESVCDLFDQFVDWAQENSLCLVWPELTADQAELRRRFCVYGADFAYSAEADADVKADRPLWERCEQLVAAIANSIADVQAAQRAKPVAEPMWE